MKHNQSECFTKLKRNFCVTFSKCSFGKKQLFKCVTCNCIIKTKKWLRSPLSKVGALNVYTGSQKKVLIKLSQFYSNICYEFYNNRNSTQSQGAVKIVDKYISGITVIKNANFEDHMKKSETHCVASLHLLEKQHMTTKTNNDKSTNSVLVGPLNQTTILPHIQKFTAIKRAQLTRKFQLAHFTATTGKSFKSYENFARFEKTYHNVDLGSAYLLY